MVTSNKRLIRAGMATSAAAMAATADADMAGPAAATEDVPMVVDSKDAGDGDVQMDGSSAATAASNGGSGVTSSNGSKGSVGSESKTGSSASGLAALGNDLPPAILAARQAVLDDPYDSDAWKRLVTDAQSRDISVARHVYEEFLKVFPTAGWYWKIYAEHEARTGSVEAVSRVLERALGKSLYIELWKYYYSYTYMTKKAALQAAAVTEAQITEFRNSIVAAYEFAIEHVGMAISSTPLWTDYLSFLNEGREDTQLEASTKKTLMRRVFQRAIAIPMHGLENIWKQYEDFEMKLNPQFATELLDRFRPIYLTAKAVYQDRRRLWNEILPGRLAIPARDKDEEADSQLDLWRRVIASEMGNPQQLKEEAYHARVRFAYSQCLDCFRLFPEMWCEYAAFEASIGDVNRARLVFLTAMDAIPGSQYIAFSAADFFELQQRYDDARAVYKRLLADHPCAQVFIMAQRFERRVAGPEAARAIFRLARASDHCTYHVFVAAAWQEYFANKQPKVGGNIFELGLKRFGDIAAYILHYLDFLTHLNDDNNMRVLFERVLNSLPADKAAPIWERYLEFELTQSRGGGGLRAAAVVEKRRTAAYEDLPEYKPGLGQFAHRYFAYGLGPAGAHDAKCTERLQLKPVDPVLMFPMMPLSASDAATEAATRAAAEAAASALEPVKITESVPLPKFLAKLNSMLPPTVSGPTVNVDHLMHSIKVMHIPRNPPVSRPAPGTVSGGFRMVPTAMGSNSPGPDDDINKRKRDDDMGDDEGTSEERAARMARRAQQSDVYRQRHSRGYGRPE